MSPLNDWMHEFLWEYTSNTIVNDKRYELIFDKLETLMALSYAYHERRPEGLYWSTRMRGSFMYRHQNRREILGEIEESIDTFQSQAVDLWLVNGAGYSATHCPEPIACER